MHAANAEGQDGMKKLQTHLELGKKGTFFVIWLHDKPGTNRVVVGQGKSKNAAIRAAYRRLDDLTNKIDADIERMMYSDLPMKNISDTT